MNSQSPNRHDDADHSNQPTPECRAQQRTKKINKSKTAQDSDDDRGESYVTCELSNKSF